MEKSTTIKQHLSEKLDLEDYVYEYPTKYIEGFTNEELNEIVEQTKIDFPNFNMEKYYNAMMCNTCMMSEDNEIINYHCDVLVGLKCGLGDRDMLLTEFD